MKWLNVESVRFPERGALLTISRQDAINFHEVVGILARFREGSDPREMSDALRTIVIRARPELVGCTIWLLHFDERILSWEIGALHPSLPAVSLGEEMPRMPLLETELVER